MDISHYPVYWTLLVHGGTIAMTFTMMLSNKNDWNTCDVIAVMDVMSICPPPRLLPTSPSLNSGRATVLDRLVS